MHGAKTASQTRLVCTKIFLNVDHVVYALPRDQNIREVQDCNIQDQQRHSSGLGQQPGVQGAGGTHKGSVDVMWCLERNIHVAVVHLADVLYTIADTESREMLDRTDWKLNPNGKSTTVMGPWQCPLSFSWQSDPYAQAIDQDWTAMKCYANPPLNLVGWVLAQVQPQQV